MQAIDFEYDGQYLSSYGFIICDFDFSNDAVEAGAGSNITFNKVPRHQGKKFSLTSTQYDECITTTFDICKNPSVYNPEDMEILDDEYRALVRWLNRRELLRFGFISDEDYEQSICYYQASFNVTKIKIREKLYGVRLTMETDRPFGYGQEQTITWTFAGGDTPKILDDFSDEIGTLYPTVIITCKGNGDLTLKNDLEKCTTVIKNCKNGEVITLYGDTQVITSSLSAHDICQDFNFEFFRIGNTITNRNNKITASLPCTITLKYAPIIKDLP